VDYTYLSMAYSTDAARWRALTIRDANANGHFIYSVRSTNVYCRPTCPARLARRANVGFHKTSFEAEAAGFRACKRCKPNSVLEDPQEQAVEKGCALIEEALRNEDPKAFRLQDLAKSVGLTPRYFHKIFKEKTGMTPKEYAKVRASQPSSTNTTPPAIVSPAIVDTIDWDLFDFNAFGDELVDFDADASATLGYNLMTGAAQPLAMGVGNAIDVNTLHQMWDMAYEPTGLDSVSLPQGSIRMNAPDSSMVADASGWQQLEDYVPAISTFESDAATLLGYDSLQAMY
jgi:methylphosphotriester-DNA--protein-cysteine methyltransferase